jgi:hypothetical protein
MSRPMRIAAFLTIGVAIACHGTSPTSPGRVPAPAASAPTRYAVSGAITGPASVPPGAAAQFRFTLRYNDGSTEDASAKAAWRSGSPQVADVQPGGMVKALSRGRANLTANFLVGSSTTVFVLEDGTYALTGHVLEAALPVDAAQVTVTRGIGQGLNSVTDGTGRYDLYGVAGDVELTVSKAGYQSATQPFSARANGAGPDFALQPGSSPTDVSGDWRMTIVPSTACAMLPDDMGPRGYAANIAQSGPRVSIRITGPVMKPPVVSGRVLGQHLTFTLSSVADYYYHGNPTYDLVELLDPTRFLGVDGTFDGDTSGAQLRGTLNGRLAVYAGTNYFASHLVTACAAKDHGVLLQR